MNILGKIKRYFTFLLIVLFTTSFLWLTPPAMARPQFRPAASHSAKPASKTDKKEKSKGDKKDKKDKKDKAKQAAASKDKADSAPNTPDVPSAN